MKHLNFDFILSITPLTLLILYFLFLKLCIFFTTSKNFYFIITVMNYKTNLIIFAYRILIAFPRIFNFHFIQIKSSPKFNFL